MICEFVLKLVDKELQGNKSEVSTEILLISNPNILIKTGQCMLACWKATFVTYFLVLSFSSSYYYTS